MRTKTIKTKLNIFKLAKIIFNFNFFIKIIILLLSKKYFYKTKSNNYIIMKTEEVIVNKLIDFSENKNDSIINEEKEQLLKFISKNIKKNITYIKSIFLDYRCRFGNQLIILNKVIFFCEILGCKRIILNKNNYWFIKNKIKYKKYKMYIEIGEEKDYKNRNIIIDKSSNFFWYNKYIIPQYRTEVIKKEILKNLPKIISNPKDIHIYIRSGDIFGTIQKGYFQPPLCFYQKILNYFKFKNYYIIAEDNKNPNINKLLNQFPNIIFNKNTLKIDISYLIYSYNIVGAFSTFLNNIIKFNDNLKFFFLFDFNVDYFFSFFFSYIFTNKNLSIFKMYSSDYYNEITICQTLNCQMDLMIKYNCKYNFTLTNKV